MVSVLFLIAAPVPPPSPLSAEMLVGRWDYRWGGMKDGWIEFMPDGRYHAKHSPGDVPAYCGTWWVNRGEIVLMEKWLSSEPCSRGAGTVYRIPVSMAKYPWLAGDYMGIPVVFSNHRR